MTNRKRLLVPLAVLLIAAAAVLVLRNRSASAELGASGTVEATATTRFFRFKDDVVVRVRPDPASAGGSIVDMRSISRVGVSDLGVNARRVRAYLNDLKETAA